MFPTWAGLIAYLKREGASWWGGTKESLDKTAAASPPSSPGALCQSALRGRAGGKAASHQGGGLPLVTSSPGVSPPISAKG